MGESKLKRMKADAMLMSCAGVQTRGGHVVVLCRPCRASCSSPWKTRANSCRGSSKPTARRASTTGYKYAALATNVDHEVLSLGQLYRDRADAENTFDKLKTSGAGAASPHTTCIVPNCLRALWR